MATPARASESLPAADLALGAGAAEEAEFPSPRQPQPSQNVLAAPRLRAPSSRGLGAAEFGGAARDVEAPGETFAQRVSLGPAESPPGSLDSGSPETICPFFHSLPWKVTLPQKVPFQSRGRADGLQPRSRSRVPAWHVLPGCLMRGPTA